MRSRPRRAATVLLLALGAVLLGATAARAGDRIGEPWEAGILEGIRAQDLAVKSRSPAAVLEAAKSLAARRSDPATTVVRLYLLARAYGLAGDQASSRGAYGEVLRSAPRCYFAWRDLAMLDVQRTPPDTASAERNLRQALTANPGYTDAARKLALIVTESGREAEAVPLLRRIVDAEPADLQARVILVKTLGRLRRFPEAQREVEALRRKDPRNPGFRDLEIELVFLQGNHAAARDLYRQLAQEFPAEAMPVIGFIRSIEAIAKAGGAADPDDYLWAVERLLRIERDPAQRKRLEDTRDGIRADIARQSAAAAGGGTRTGPPTEAELLGVLRGNAPEGRRAALQYVFAREEAPSPEVLRATMERLDSTREPFAAARQWALRVLARFGGYGLAGLVRLSLTDPDPAVRVSAVDALLSLAPQDASARGVAVLVLGPLGVASGDDALATAARLGVAQLAAVDLGDASGASEADLRASFQRWWGGPVGGEAKIRSLEAFGRLKDRLPETVLLPYVQDPDFAVVAAAYRALEQAAAAPPAEGARAAWWRSFPRIPAEELVPENRAAIVGRVDAWAAARPR